MEKACQPHSAEYFGQERDYWWNLDFLDLMAKRWELEKVKSVLDVGCGLGHWGRLVAKFLPKDAKLTGIDREEKWIQGAAERVKDEPGMFTYQIGSAEEIPFEDNSFDLVTCQTVLLHVKDANVAVKEMLRVLKPGGLIACVEPNNIANELLFDSCSVDDKVEEIARSVKFHLLCERGAEKQGLGFGSVGDRLPRIFNQFGLKEIKVFLSDKASAMQPPYECHEQMAYVQQMKEWYDQELFIWTRDETKTYYLAGGGTAVEFDEMWEYLKRRYQMQLEAIAKRKYFSAGGHVFYLVSARK